MSYRSRGFLAGLFGGRRRANPSLFPPQPATPPDAPRPARPPAAPPGIVIEPPRPERPRAKLPADVPPPAPAPVAAPVARVRPEPPPEPPPLPPPVADTSPPLQLAAPVAARPAALASALHDHPAPLPLGRLAARLPPPPPGEAVPDTFAELSDLAAGAATVALPGFWAGQLRRLVVAPPAPASAPEPLLPGTEGFTDPAIVAWHGLARPWPEHDVACSFVADAVVTGPGHVWLDGKLVTAPEIMPGYVRDLHRIETEGARLLGVHGLKLREIAAPCVVLLGHGLQVYGHFVIELLFRVLLARRALRGTGLAARWLLDAAAPAWLLTILEQDLGIVAADIEFFDATRERVRLRHAILPGLLLRDEGFHPLASELIEELLESLAPLPAVPPARRLFVARHGFRNAHSRQRDCINEAALVALAEARGFVPIAAEELPWRQQVALFRNAEIVVGTFGSGLHTALVAGAGTRIGCVGMLNRTQSVIGALRGHRMAYLTQGFALEGQFTVPEDAFARFVEALCAGADDRRPAVAPAQVAVAPAAAPAVPADRQPGAVAIARPGFVDAGLARYVVAEAVTPLASAPLLAGTVPFAAPPQRAFHREPRARPARDAACYFARNVVAGAAGRVWLDGAPVTVPELMPKSPAASPEADAAVAALPLRWVDEPCAVLPGPVADSYAGLMIELLPRLLLARRAFQDSGERIRLLLDGTTPRGLVQILRGELGFVNAELERFDPAVERIGVRQALLPAVLYRDGAFHPVVSNLLDELAGRLDLPTVPQAARLFLHRNLPPGATPDTPRSDCQNEPALIALAEARHGFVPIVLDGLPWRQRLARLRLARVVLVGHGVPVPTLLLAGYGVRVAYIGVRTTLPAEIGAARSQRLAYLSEGVPPKGPFTLPEERFAAFLDALCDPNAEKVQAA